jgi:hydrocephalus-inducing protein
MERPLVAKAAHVEPLKVVNWLHKPQRFKVLITRLAGDASTRLEGPEVVDVPPLSDREYKLQFYSYTQVGPRGTWWQVSGYHE